MAQNRKTTGLAPYGPKGSTVAKKARRRQSKGKRGRWSQKQLRGEW